MKKVLLLATAFMFVTGISIADNGKGKNKKKCAKGKTCCSKDANAKTTKSCCKEKSTTAKM